MDKMVGFMLDTSVLYFSLRGRLQKKPGDMKTFIYQRGP